MLVMGISGGPTKTHEDGSSHINRFAFHDSSAVLLDEGEVVAAIELERLNRIKHSNKFPTEAIRCCLDTYGANIQDLDYLAYYADERSLNGAVEQWTIQRTLENNQFIEYWDARSLLQGLLSSEFDYKIPQERLVFVNHHYAHALSAFVGSGFEESLVATLDAQGDSESGRIMSASKSSMEILASFPVSQSLGGIYISIIRTIGFQQFDEYKAMGLAPYGDPLRFRGVFDTFYSLLPAGGYSMNWEQIGRLHHVLKPRKHGEEFTQEYMDIAAALQELLQKIVFHILTYYREKTKLGSLCLAGGVAHNCTLNGQILNSKLFDRVFVQPAAHDAGCAYGAALSVYNGKPEIKIAPLKHLYWGTDIGDNDSIAVALDPWRDFVSIEKIQDVCCRAAGLIADGKVIGWAQGRSEFGPRALGNRSILADPRPAENKSIINAMVKKRESFRPFAPSVLEEKAEEFFEVDASNRNLAYMVFVVSVRPEKRQLLGAVTHVDGTARIQIVSKKLNPKYWNLINAFNEITRTPILLNTSFNNNCEPIVNSVQDVVICFLTTQLDYVIVGDYLVSKKKSSLESFWKLVPSLPTYTIISQTRRADQRGRTAVFFECMNNFNPTFREAISPEVFDILLHADGEKTLQELTAQTCRGNNGSPKDWRHQLHDLWSRRIITLVPRLGRYVPRGLPGAYLKSSQPQRQ